jgi:hypothetical protein
MKVKVTRTENTLPTFCFPSGQKGTSIASVIRVQSVHNQVGQIPPIQGYL